MLTRAVVFDLWETLVDWPLAAMDGLHVQWAAALGIPRGELDRRWNELHRERNTGPLDVCLRAVGAADGDVAALVELRREVTRRALVPRPGAVATLEELGRRGLGRGLISMCTGEVPALWPETELAPHFESTLFSASCGLMKPDRRIYELACEQLGVRPEEALFVGDGANDELAGAERAGLRAVLVHRPGRPPIWPGLDRWDGPRITSPTDVLELV